MNCTETQEINNKIETDARIKSLKKCLAETVDCIEALAGRMGIIDQLKLQPDYIEWKKELNK